MANSGLRPAYIEKGTIIDVDPKTWAVEVYRHASTCVSWIDWCTPYVHSMKGEGIHFVPEVGASVWVCTPSEGLGDIQPFIIAFANETDDNKAKGNRMNRPDMNPGDVFLGTRNGNKIILRRGGVLQIGATEAATRYYIPTYNIIRDLCENYELASIAGDMRWTVDRTSDDADAPCLTLLGARQFSTDKNYLVEIKIGDDVGVGGGIENVVMSTAVYSDGTASRQLVVGVDISKDGNVSFGVVGSVEGTVVGNFVLEVLEKLSLTVGSMEIVSGTYINVEADDSLTIKSGGAKIQVDSSGKVSINAATEVNIQAPRVVCAGGKPLLTVDFLSAFMSHTHGAPVPTTGSVTPTVAPALAGATTKKLVGG